MVFFVVSMLLWFFFVKKMSELFPRCFFETTEPDSYGRERKIYLMDRDGFTLLAMGFSGKKAMEFELKYIKAFNEMERLKTHLPTKIKYKIS